MANSEYKASQGPIGGKVAQHSRHTALAKCYACLLCLPLLLLEKQVRDAVTYNVSSIVDIMPKSHTTELLKVTPNTRKNGLQLLKQ